MFKVENFCFQFVQGRRYTQGTEENIMSNIGIQCIHSWQGWGSNLVCHCVFKVENFCLQFVKGKRFAEDIKKIYATESTKEIKDVHFKFYHNNLA